MQALVTPAWEVPRDAGTELLHPVIRRFRGTAGPVLRGGQPCEAQAP